MLGFHNTETIIEKAKSGRDVFVLLGEVSQHPSDIVCPKCGCKMHIHGSYPTCLRHLNFGGKLSCVSFNKSRYENYLDYIYSYYDRDYTPTDAEALSEMRLSMKVFTVPIRLRRTCSKKIGTARLHIVSFAFSVLPEEVMIGHSSHKGD